MSASGDPCDGEQQLDEAVANWLLEREGDPQLLPSAFASRLPEALRSRFLQEIEDLATIDGLASETKSRDLPERLGGFRVFGELGRGATGVVYEAEEIATGRMVALKILHPHVAGDPRSAARFRREAQTASALRHPGIAAVLDCGEVDELTWLALECVPGRSLERLLAAVRDQRDLDYDRAHLLADPKALAGAIADVADALEFAHRHGVVHRDIKPANLMLRDGGGIAVLDFGLASARDPSDSSPSLTNDGDLLGTPLYMAPEQAIGAENGSARSDVYGLGAVLYECLCGRPPVAPGSLAIVLDALQHQDPEPPHRVRSGVPIELSRVAMQCLEKRPERRYPTAAALAEDLRRFVAGEAVQARTFSLPRRIGRQLRRRPFLAAVAVTLVALAPLGYWAWQARSVDERRIEGLERDRDLARLPQMLAGAPEHITVFGGASLRHYERLGLARTIPRGDGARSSQAQDAVALAASLRQRFPSDASVLRAYVEVLLDVGDVPDEVDTLLGELLASDRSVAADRAMAAVFHLRRGRAERAERLFASLPEKGVLRAPDVDYWLGFWHQSTQDYPLAIAAFSRALAARDLSEEHRYFALLHRGWCRSCPEVHRPRLAQDDLLQAAALRPGYGTARLLWAALHCLDDQPDLDRAVTEVLTVLEGAEPWLCVLTARVLQSLAEAGTWQDGPVRFGSEFSPIASVPIPGSRAAALAGLSLQLLDDVAKRLPDSFEVAFHRAAALALLARHDEGLDALRAALAGSPPAAAAPLHLQIARVQLAAGRGERAHAAIERSLDAAPDYVTGWRFAATLARHLGNRQRELLCVTQAIRLLRRDEPELAVYPDAIALLPELELHRRELQQLLGRDVGAALTEQPVDAVGGRLRGGAGMRARSLVAGHLGRTDAGADPRVLTDAAAMRSPLRWLLADGDSTLNAADDRGLAVAAWRGWLPASARLPDTERTRALREVRGESAPERVVGVGLTRLLPNAAELVRADRAARDLLQQRCIDTLAADPEHGEARLLRGVLLLASGRALDACRFMAETGPRFPNDLRSRFVHACAAAALRDRDELRAALSVGGDLLDLRTLEGAAAAVTLPDVASPAELLSLAR